MNAKRNEDRKIYGVYVPSVLTMKTQLSIVEVGKNNKQNLERKLAKSMEGKCIAAGYIRPNSIKIISYSGGEVNSEYVTFQVVFECMICRPVEGMLIECTTKTITKAGIHAEVIDEQGNIPVTAFIARDHHMNNNHFNNVQENTKIVVNVIGVRYEENDPCICVISKLSSGKQFQGGSVESVDNSDDDEE